MHTKYFLFIVTILVYGGIAFGAHAATYPPGFLADPAYYPLTVNPNVLPNGTLVKTALNPTVYYIQD